MCCVFKKLGVGGLKPFDKAFLFLFFFAEYAFDHFFGEAECLDEVGWQVVVFSYGEARFKVFDDASFCNGEDDVAFAFEA